MTNLRRTGIVAWNASIALGLIGLSLALYVAAYYATVKKGEVIYSSFPSEKFVPFYSRSEAERYLALFFTPIHRLDRYLRPDIWDPKNP